MIFLKSLYHSVYFSIKKFKYELLLLITSNIFCIAGLYFTSVNTGDFIDIVLGGGYLVNQGYLPYKDFLLPLGPILFFLQGLFFTIFGIHWISHSLLLGTLASIISIFFFKLTKPHIGSILAIISSFLMIFTITGRFFWLNYNQIAWFFFIICIFVIIKNLISNTHSSLSLISQGVLCVACFFCKQDLGLMLIGFITIFYTFLSYKSNKWSLVFIIILSIITSLSLSFLLFNFWGDFFNQFNFGQSEHSSRLSIKIFYEIFKQLGFYPILIASISFFVIVQSKTTNFIQYLLVLLTGTIFIETIFLNVSGNLSMITIHSLSIQAIIVILIISKLIQNQTHKLFFYKSIMLSLSVLIIVLILFPVLLGQSFNYRFQEGPLKGLKTNVPETTFNEINTLIREHNSNFFALIHTRLLTNALHSNIAIKALPLWFHNSVSFFDKDINPMIKTVIKTNPSLVLVEETKGPGDFLYPFPEKLIETLQNLGYQEKEKIIGFRSAVRVFEIK